MKYLSLHSKNVDSIPSKMNFEAWKERQQYRLERLAK